MRRPERVAVDNGRVVRLGGVLHQELPVARDGVLVPADAHEVLERPLGEREPRGVAQQLLELRRRVRGG